MKNIKITGFGLKMIAIVTMLIDHIAVVFLERAAAAGNVFIEDNMRTFAGIDLVMRLIGRMAFPLFAFLLVEGFVKTRSVPKYLLRLGIFAIISEIPFDMALSFRDTNLAASNFWDKYLPLLNTNNVMITLFIGLLMIWMMDLIAPFFERRETGKKAFGWLLLHMFVIFVIMLIGMIAAFFTSCDYGAAGVISIFLIYILKDHKMIGFAAAVVALCMLVSSIEIVALFMLLPIYYYNGERGRDMKYFFYAFYPGHLLILAGIAWAIGLPLFIG